MNVSRTGTVFCGTPAGVETSKRTTRTHAFILPRNREAVKRETWQFRADGFRKSVLRKTRQERNYPPPRPGAGDHHADVRVPPGPGAVAVALRCPWPRR